MGIPLFFRWLVENYPKVLANSYIDSIKFNNLYIDMNGVIHNAIKIDKRGKYGLIYKEDIKDDEIKSSIYSRLDAMINQVNPSNLLYIGIDGVPPRAKAVEQRRRRFKSVKESKANILTILKSASKSTQYISDQEIQDIQSKVFDSNSISPATEFIEKINGWIKEYCEKLSIERPNLTIVLSDSTVPGEGEHKIMDYIRSNHSKLLNGLNGNNQFERRFEDEQSEQSEQQQLTHCFYGMDADLIFLGLESHLPNFYILRDSLQLLECKTCDSNDHLSYECKSAYALKKSLIKKSKIVQLKQVPTSCNEQDIRNLFEFYGNIISIDIKRANTKLPSLQVIIEFENEETVDLISKTGLSFIVNNRRVPVVVEFLDNPFKSSNDEENVTGGVSGTKDNEDLNTEDQDNANEDSSNVIVVEDENVPDNTIYVGGLDLLVSKFDVKTFFEQFGSIETFNLAKSPRFQKQQYSMIKYKTQESARLAFKSSGIEFFGTSIIIKKSSAKTNSTTSTASSTTSSTTSSNTGTANDATSTTATTTTNSTNSQPSKEVIKELKRIENENKCEELLKMLDKDTPKEVATFYMGISGWEVEKAYENYIKFGKATLKSPAVSGFTNNAFDFVNLDSFRLYLEYYLLENINQDYRDKVDFNRCINDITLLFTFLGNDFVPHLPSFLISFGSLELTLSWYKEWIQKSINQIIIDSSNNSGIHYVTNQEASKIIFENIIPLFESLEKWESYQYPSFLKKQIIKNNRKDSLKSTSAPSTPTTTTTSVNNNNNNIHTLKDIESSNKPNNKPFPSPPSSAANNIQNEEDIEYNDLTYYRIKLELTDKSDSEVKEFVQEMCYQYLLALHWILIYYTQGCPSWTWFYPYHYAPLAKDLLEYMKKLVESNSSEELFKFKLDKPIEPLIHLTSILPRNSSDYLPSQLKELMYSPSPISSYYNEDIKIDMNGEFALWKGILLLPFMDYDKLYKLASPIVDSASSTLTKEELKRNEFGKNMKIKNSVVQIIDSNKLKASKEIDIKLNENEKPIQDFSNDNAALLANYISINDLRYPTRRYSTLSPYDSDQYRSFNAIPTTQAPSSNRTEAPKLTESQLKFLDWRKNVTGINKSLEILESIDFSKCFCINVDKKLISSQTPSNSIISYLGRLLNNESISSDNSILIQSIDDSQMIINIGFNKPTKLNSIQFVSQDNNNQDLSKSSIPNVIKLYVNQPNSIDFSNINSINETSLINFKSIDELKLCSKPFTLNPNQYKSVIDLTILIDSNFSNNKNQISSLQKIILS